MVPTSGSEGSEPRSGGFGDAADMIAAALGTEAVARLARTADRIGIRGHEYLFREGDPADAAYLVLSGRLQIVSRWEKGGGQLIREVGPGEILGELGILSDRPRSASVRAVRDSELVRISRGYFGELLDPPDRPTTRLLRDLAHRLRVVVAGTSNAECRTVAVVPLSSSIPVTRVARELAAALAHIGPVAFVDQGSLSERFGKRARLGESPGAAADGAAARWLNELETNHRFIVLEASPVGSPWMERCVRHSDRLLCVAPIRERPSALTSLIGGSPVPRPELLILHSSAIGNETSGAWIESYPFSAHHHVRVGSAAGFARVARTMVGRAVGLVLSGGGARGYAHIGVIKALLEADVMIDRIGGTSIGAMIAAQYAMGLSCEAMLDFHRREWVNRSPMRSYTLPLVSFLSPTKSRRAMTIAFGGTRIEDLNIPFFCVSANLTTAQLAVHRLGPLATYILASLSLPGVASPVVSETGDLLVDGGILDNLPVGVMRASGDGPVIAVDVSPRVDALFRSTYRSTPTAWQVLRDRMAWKDRTSFPSLVRIVQRASLLSSTQRASEARIDADLYLNPPVGKFDLFNWQALDRIARAGYEYGTNALTQMESSLRSRITDINH